MWRCTTHGWKHTYGDNFMKPVLSFHLNMVWRPKPDLSNKHDGPMSHITHSWNLNFSEFHHWFYGFCHQCMFIALFLLSTLAHWWTCISSAGHCLNDGAILVNLCQLLLVFQTFVLWLCWPFNVLLDIHVNFRVILWLSRNFSGVLTEIALIYQLGENCCLHWIESSYICILCVFPIL